MPFTLSSDTFSLAFLEALGLILFQKIWWDTHAWRRRPVKREFSVLAGIYLLGPSLLFLRHGDPAVWLLTLSFGAVYVMVFGCASVRSPSFEILLSLWERPGQTANELQENLGKPALLKDRLRDLESEKLTATEGLTWRGKLVAGFFFYLRAFLGQPRGTG